MIPQPDDAALEPSSARHFGHKVDRLHGWYLGLHWGRAPNFHGGVHRVHALGHNTECDFPAATARPRPHCRGQIRNQILTYQSETIDRVHRVQWARESTGNLPYLQEA